uniref:Uncharacterized protein n=1 Tax=Rhizophora mucronata TaxID=61149 RepID=A0A2P2P869_RHIMU
MRKTTVSFVSVQGHFLLFSRLDRALYGYRPPHSYQCLRSHVPHIERHSHYGRCALRL